MFVYFTDIRDACAAQTKLHQVDQDWKVAFANPTRVAQSQGTHMELGGNLDSHHPIELDKFSNFTVGLSHTGQVQIFAVVPPGSVVDPVQTMGVAHRFLQSHGRLFAFVRLSTFPNGSFRAVAEFCDTTAAFPVIQTCSSGISTEVCHSRLLYPSIHVNLGNYLGNSALRISLQFGCFVCLGDYRSNGGDGCQQESR